MSQQQQTSTRHVSDSMGDLTVPTDALYGAQTQRAIQNFPISGTAMPERFIRALLSLKQAAAQANVELKQLSPKIGEAIQQSCEQLQNDPQLMRHFPVDVYQTGSGTSTNMNANEVIATLASRYANQDIHPNDHVNCSQSSNDVIPTCIHLSAALALQQQLLPALQHLADTIDQKSEQLQGIVKTGRTHLMDAMPIRFEQILQGWRTQITNNYRHLQSLQPSLQALAQGGTAVGTGVNAPAGFADAVCRHLSANVGLTCKPADNLVAAISSQDTAVAVSGQLKTTAVSLMKIANDLRWMNSGPLAGLGEIELQALQPGSSIMPGKVNPVIPEAVTMAAAQVMGHDTAITVAGQSGNFELNVMLPLIAHNLLDSLTLLSNSSRQLADHAIATFTVNHQRCQQALAQNPILVTALNPIIGYNRAADIAKRAYQEKRPVIDVAEEMTNLTREELEHYLDPARLTQQS